MVFGGFFFLFFFFFFLQEQLSWLKPVLINRISLLQSQLTCGEKKWHHLYFTYHNFLEQESFMILRPLLPPRIAARGRMSKFDGHKGGMVRSRCRERHTVCVDWGSAVGCPGYNASFRDNLSVHTCGTVLYLASRPWPGDLRQHLKKTDCKQC